MARVDIRKTTTQQAKADFEQLRNDVQTVGRQLRPAYAGLTAQQRAVFKTTIDSVINGDAIDTLPKAQACIRALVAYVALLQTEADYLRSKEV